MQLFMPRTLTVNITNSFIRFNKAINYPSAIQNYGSKITIDNTTIANNTEVLKQLL